jgi:hypothetical protein
MWRRHKDHAAERARWEAQIRADEAAFEAMSVDYRSWYSFYNADDLRHRGDEVTVCDVEDGELVWRITWCATTEVIAWPRRWCDESSHPGIVASGAGDSAGNVVGIGPQPIPELISVVGRAATPDEARGRLRTASNLRDVRASLSAPAP